MFDPKYILVTLAAAGLFGCGSLEEAAPINGGTTVEGTSAVMVRAAGAAGNLSFFVFGKNGGDFLYHSRHDGGWNDQREMTLDLPFGSYKFTFAKEFGNTLKLSEPISKFGDVKFVLSKHPSEAGYYSSADELYLQDLPRKADSTYTVNSLRPTVVSPRLTRAVGQVNVVLKRIKDDGEGGYTEDPYLDGANVMGMIGNIRIAVSGVATSVDTDGGKGTGMVLHDIGTFVADSVDGNGFVSLAGPFVIPPASGEISVDIVVTPNTPGTGDIIVPTITGSITRNRQMIITLLTKDLTQKPQIHVSVDTEQLMDEGEGESGLWE